MKLDDGGGSGVQAKVNTKKELCTFSVVESETEAATDSGLAFNLNSGEVTSIASGDATLLYFKNEESTPYIIDGIAVGLRGFTGLTDMAVITILKNPTTGDLITDATAADIKSNTNFGSSNSLNVGTVAYRGKNSGTVTGSEETHAIIYANNNSRIAPPLIIELPKGSSIAIKVDSDATAGTAYAAIIGHSKDPLRLT